MVDLVLGTEIDVEIEIPAIPTFKIDIPAPNVFIELPTAFEVAIEQPAIPSFRMEKPEAPDVLVVPVPGIPGSGGGTQEVYVQQTEPTQGVFPWLLAQTDNDGDVEFLKVYEP